MASLVCKNHYICITYGDSPLQQNELTTVQAWAEKFFGVSGGPATALDKYVKFFGTDQPTLGSTIKWSVEQGGVSDLTHIHVLWSITSQFQYSRLFQEMERDIKASIGVPFGMYECVASVKDNIPDKKGIDKRAMIQRHDQSRIAAASRLKQSATKSTTLSAPTAPLAAPAAPVPTPVPVPVPVAPTPTMSMPKLAPPVTTQLTQLPPYVPHSVAKKEQKNEEPAEEEEEELHEVEDTEETQEQLPEPEPEVRPPQVQQQAPHRPRVVREYWCGQWIYRVVP